MVEMLRTFHLQFFSFFLFLQMLKDQVTENSTQLQQITGLLQYSIEVLKEPDPSAFLLVRTRILSIGLSVCSSYSLCGSKTENAPVIEKMHLLNSSCTFFISSVFSLVFAFFFGPRFVRTCVNVNCKRARVEKKKRARAMVLNVHIIA